MHFLTLFRIRQTASILQNKIGEQDLYVESMYVRMSSCTAELSVCALCRRDLIEGNDAGNNDVNAEMN